MPEPKAAYSVKEVATLMGFHPDTIRTMFRGEPGVIELKRPEQMHKRKYTSMRIPQAVFERMLRKISH